MSELKQEILSDPLFQEGVQAVIDSIIDNIDTYASDIKNKGVKFCLTMLQSFYDSITEEPIEIPYKNPYECDCSRCKLPEGETVTTSTEGEGVYLRPIKTDMDNPNDDYIPDGLVY